MRSISHTPRTVIIRGRDNRVGEPKNTERRHKRRRKDIRVDISHCERTATGGHDVANSWAYLRHAKRGAIARTEMHKTARALRGKLMKRRRGKITRQRKPKIHQQPSVMCTQGARAVVHEGDDAVSTTCIRTAGMRNGAVEAKDVTWL